MNDRYGWQDRDERERNRGQSGESSRPQTDDYRHSYGRGAGPRDLRSEDDDWRSRSQDAGPGYQGRSDSDRNQGGTYGYGEGRGYDEGPVGGYGASAGGYGYSNQGRGAYGGSRQSYAGQTDQGRRYTSSAYGYGSGQQGDTTPPHPYFTGQQQGWEVPAARGAPGSFGASYGGGTGTYGGGFGGSQGFGEDYREHGYGAGGGRGFLARAGDEIASWFGDDEAARRREEDHRGRGPEGYTRSDERIREDANDRLTDDPRVDARAITLTVESGEITLSGTVSSREQKRRAEDVVENISGVKHVQNNLRVQQETSGWNASGSGSSAGASAGSTAGTSASTTGTGAKASDTSSN